MSGLGTWKERLGSETDRAERSGRSRQRQDWEDLQKGMSYQDQKMRKTSLVKLPVIHEKQEDENIAIHSA